MEIQIEQGMIPSRDLISSDWYQARWPHVRLKETRRAAYTNTRGGTRWAAAPNAKKVTGRHVHRIIMDDPNDANSAEGDSDAEMQRVNGWHDAALGTRLLQGGAKIVIQQRLHENDMSGHLLEADADRWYKLCLPEEYDPKHPFVWPDDPRKQEGDLLWPELFGPARHAERLKTMGARRAAGQLQQEPAPRAGEILERAFWRYFDPEHLAMVEEGVHMEELPPEHPFRKLQMLLVSWDTSLKELNSSDPCAGGIFGIRGGDRFLLKTRHDRLSEPATRTAMLEQREWCLARFPHASHIILIENKANGTEIVKKFRRTVPGLAVYNPGDLDKIARAKNASGDFESGNIWIAGAPNGDGTDYDPLITPGWAQEVIEQCARFPKGRHDDLVDMVCQAINWVRFRATAPAEMWSPEEEILPMPYGIPTGSTSILGSS
jgi:predicted phage terminase large subunit-like protein